MNQRTPFASTAEFFNKIGAKRPFAEMVMPACAIVVVVRGQVGLYGPLEVKRSLVCEKVNWRKKDTDLTIADSANAKACSVRILIVEDDAAMARGLAERLKLSGFAVDIESDGASAMQTALLEPYSLIILDINLPNVSGFEVLHRIRQSGSTVPVMIFTARYAVDDKVSGLDLGADDYLSKPFDIAEFDARVRALVRRGQGLPNPTLICGPLAFDRAAGTITLSGKPLELRRREFAVLEVLMTRAGKLVSKERLIAEVFGFDEPVAPNAAELYVARVRQKLGPDGPRIRTVRGLGYLLEV